MRNTRENLAWIWQNAEKALIVIFFLTFTLNIRKVFLTPYSFLNGGFNEYTTISVSWADVLMIATMLIYTIKYIISQPLAHAHSETIYYNNSDNKSTITTPPNVSHETFFLLLFLGWIGLSIFWSQFWPIALYKFLTLVKIAFFAFIAVKSLKYGKWLGISLFAVILNGLFQSLLGIAQFIHNSSLGIHFLGESILGPNINGVAKIIIDGEKHIRAYGTTPHPNILAGFLLIPLFLILAEFVQRWLLPASSHPTPSLPLLRGGGLTDRFPLLDKPARRYGGERAGVRSVYVSHETLLGYLPSLFLYISLTITGLGFILTFSRSAFLGLFVGLAIYFIWGIFSWRTTKIFRANSKSLILVILVIAFATIILVNKTSIFSNQSLEERTLYQNVSYETISSHPVGGIGIGQFVINSYYEHPNLESWQYQPVHNIYLLIFSELGAIGLILFLLFLISIFSKIHQARGSVIRVYYLTYLSFCCIILSFLTISFFDHYFWDIKLGTIISVSPLILCFIAETSRRDVPSVNKN